MVPLRSFSFTHGSWSIALIFMFVASGLTAEASHGGDPCDLGHRIDTATPGEILVVSDCVIEGTFVVDKPLTLLGDDATIVRPAGTALTTPLLDIRETATVDGFRFEGGGAGVSIAANDTTVRNNTFHHMESAIATAACAGLCPWSNLDVSDNTITVYHQAFYHELPSSISIELDDSHDARVHNNLLDITCIYSHIPRIGTLNAPETAFHFYVAGSAFDVADNVVTMQTRRNGNLTDTPGSVDEPTVDSSYGRCRLGFVLTGDGTATDNVMRSDGGWGILAARSSPGEDGKRAGHGLSIQGMVLEGSATTVQLVGSVRLSESYAENLIFASLSGTATETPVLERSYLSLKPETGCNAALGGTALIRADGSAVVRFNQLEGTTCRTNFHAEAPQGDGVRFYGNNVFWTDMGAPPVTAEVGAALFTSPATNGGVPIGNYWAGTAPIDQDGDLRGDLPVTIYRDSNVVSRTLDETSQDTHPLLHPVENGWYPLDANLNDPPCVDVHTEARVLRQTLVTSTCLATTVDAGPAGASPGTAQHYLFAGDGTEDATTGRSHNATFSNAGMTQAHAFTIGRLGHGQLFGHRFEVLPALDVPDLELRFAAPFTFVQPGATETVTLIAEGTPGATFALAFDATDQLELTGAPSQITLGSGPTAFTFDVTRTGFAWNPDALRAVTTLDDGVTTRDATMAVRVDVDLTLFAELLDPIERSYLVYGKALLPDGTELPSGYAPEIIHIDPTGAARDHESHEGPRGLYHTVIHIADAGIPGAHTFRAELARGPVYEVAEVEVEG